MAESSELEDWNTYRIAVRAKFNVVVEVTSNGARAAARERSRREDVDTPLRFMRAFCEEQDSELDENSPRRWDASRGIPN